VRAKDQADRSSSERQAILNTISQFEAAFNRRDLAALRSIWTGMPKAAGEVYRNEFRDTRSLEFRLTPVGPPDVNHDQATVICTRTQNFVAKNGAHPPPTSDRVRVALVRVGSQWNISAISPLGSE
jgi:hypothetical protein